MSLKRPKAVPDPATEITPGEGTPATLATHADFAQQAIAVFRQIQTTVLHVIKKVPGTIRRAVDLQRALEIDQPLAWRVFKIGCVDDPLDVVKYVPSPGEIPTFLEAARKKKVPLAIIAEVRTAFETYTEFVREHAGNRESLRTMVASLQQNTTNLIDEKDRKILFEANSRVWGQQIDVAVACYIVQPDWVVGTLQKAAAIVGQVGYHQLRAGLTDKISMQNRIQTQDGTFVQPESVTALLREFCSADLFMQSHNDAQQFMVASVELPRLGRRSAVNAFHLFTSNIMTYEDDSHINMLISYPCAMIHLDLLVPAIAHSRTCYARVFGRLDNTPAAREKRLTDAMPVQLSAVYMGSAIDAPAAPDVPRYSDMVRRVLEHQGWYGMNFDIYRCRLTYPVLHSLVHLQATRKSVAGE